MLTQTEVFNEGTLYALADKKSHIKWGLIVYKTQLRPAPEEEPQWYHVYLTLGASSHSVTVYVLESEKDIEFQNNIIEENWVVSDICLS